MSERTDIHARVGAFVLLAIVLLCGAASFAQEPGQEPSQEQPQEVQRLPEAQEFFVHEFHATQLELDCSVCHVPAQENSTVLKRPGHDQCILCHEANYEEDLSPKFCGQCHASFPPFDNEDLLPFPFFQKKRAILFDFSHALHVDPNARLDPKTGFRADCTFCHKFDEQGIFAKMGIRLTQVAPRCSMPADGRLPSEPDRIRVPF